MTTRRQSIAELERRFDENHSEVNSRFDEVNQRVNQIQLALDTNMEELRGLILNLGRGPSAESVARGGTPQHNEQNQVRGYSTRLSKVEFPRFDGKKVKDWLYKCDQFFLLDETPPESRVRLASVHLEGLALQWHLNYMRGRFDQYPVWEQYRAEVKRRFGDLYEDPLADLIKVKQSSSIQSYIDDFELAHTQVSLLP